MVTLWYNRTLKELGETKGIGWSRGVPSRKGWRGAESPRKAAVFANFYTESNPRAFKHYEQVTTMGKKIPLEKLSLLIECVTLKPCKCGRCKVRRHWIRLGRRYRCGPWEWR